MLLSHLLLLYFFCLYSFILYVPSVLYFLLLFLLFTFASTYISLIICYFLFFIFNVFFPVDSLISIFYVCIIVFSCVLNFCSLCQLMPTSYSFAVYCCMLYLFVLLSVSRFFLLNYRSILFIISLPASFLLLSASLSFSALPCNSAVFFALFSVLIICYSTISGPFFCFYHILLFSLSLNFVLSSFYI